MQVGDLRIFDGLQDYLREKHPSFQTKLKLLRCGQIQALMRSLCAQKWIENFDEVGFFEKVVPILFSKNEGEKFLTGSVAVKRIFQKEELFIAEDCCKLRKKLDRLALSAIEEIVHYLLEREWVKKYSASKNFYKKIVNSLPPKASGIYLDLFPKIRKNLDKKEEPDIMASAYSKNPEFFLEAMYLTRHIECENSNTVEIMLNHIIFPCLLTGREIKKSWLKEKSLLTVRILTREEGKRNFNNYDLFNLGVALASKNSFKIIFLKYAEVFEGRRFRQILQAKVGFFGCYSNDMRKKFAEKCDREIAELWLDEIDIEKLYDNYP